MKNSLYILGFFALGILVAQCGIAPLWLLNENLSSYLLYTMLFLVGIGIGFDSSCLRILRQMHIKILLVPLATIVGTCAGAFAVAPFISDMSLREVLAIGNGYGYYSLSSIIITQMGNSMLGSIALLSNITREMTTLLAAPFIVYAFGKYAPIAAGGATSMDTCLPIITRFTNERYAIVSIFHGIVLTTVVPFIVTFLMR